MIECKHTDSVEIIPITAEDLAEFVEMNRHRQENPSITSRELHHWLLKHQGLGEDRLDAIMQWPDGPRYNPCKRKSYGRDDFGK